MTREGMTSLKKDILDENIRKYFGNFSMNLVQVLNEAPESLTPGEESMDIVNPATTWAESQSSQNKRRESFNYVNHAAYF